MTLFAQATSKAAGRVVVAGTCLAQSPSPTWAPAAGVRFFGAFGANLVDSENDPTPSAGTCETCPIAGQLGNDIFSRILWATNSCKGLCLIR